MPSLILEDGRSMARYPLFWQKNRPLGQADVPVVISAEVLENIQYITSFTCTYLSFHYVSVFLWQIRWQDNAPCRQSLVI